MKLTNWATDRKARCGLRGFTEKKKKVCKKKTENDLVCERTRGRIDTEC